MTVGDYSSEQFKDRVVKLIRKMGEAWDKDDRVAFVQMGLIGYWGEQHSPAPDYEMQQLLGNTFNEVFKNKKVMVRNYNEFTDFDFGFYWDSFAHIDQTRFLEGMIERGDYWKTHVNGGETAYDWGGYKIQPGLNPNESLGKREHLDYLIECARRLHTNHLGWISKYDLDDPQAVAGAAEFQKVMGYRFVVKEAKFMPSVKENEKLAVELSIQNVGSTPLYENYPLQISLIDPETKERVWQSTFEHTDCRKWMPGDDWNKTGKYYETVPETYIVKGDFTISAVLPGEYILAVSLLDPYSLKPSVRFAQDNYLQGGYTVIGRIGLNHTVSDHSLNGIIFDNISDELFLPN